MNRQGSQERQGRQECETLFEGRFSIALTGFLHACQGEKPFLNFLFCLPWLPHLAPLAVKFPSPYLTGILLKPVNGYGGGVSG